MMGRYYGQLFEVNPHTGEETRLIFGMELEAADITPIADRAAGMGLRIGTVFGSHAYLWWLTPTVTVNIFPALDVDELRRAREKYTESLQELRRDIEPTPIANS